MNYTQFMFLKILCQYLCVYYCHTFANIEFISHYLIPSLFEKKCLWDAIGPFRAYDTYWPKSTSPFQIRLWLNINTSYMRTYQYLQTISLIFPYFGLVSWSIQKIDILFYQIHVFFYSLLIQKSFDPVITSNNNCKVQMNLKFPKEAC